MNLRMGLAVALLSTGAMLPSGSRLADCGAPAPRPERPRKTKGNTRFMNCTLRDRSH